MRVFFGLFCMVLMVGCSSDLNSLGGRNKTFEQVEVPQAPDYSRSDAWAASIAAPGASSSLPAGVVNRDVSKDVDVFYIHPTTYRSVKFWNQDIADDKVNAWTDASVVAYQAGVFNECCRIFVPRYRQASMKASKDYLMQGDGAKAYTLAYKDIQNAFSYYMTNENQGQPFIIAGHSQGGLLAYRLLRDYIDGTDLEARMIAAYVIGIDVVEGDFGKTYNSLIPCQTPKQTSCILSWNAVTPEADIEAMLKFSGARYASRYKTEDGRSPICINPVTFDSSRPKSSREQSKGAVVGTPSFEKMGNLLSGSVAAACDRGYLIVDMDEELQLTALEGGSLHYHEYGLFYKDIRDNILERIAAFKAD